MFYKKVFDSILESSLADDRRIRTTFMDLLLCSDWDGYIDMSLMAIYRKIGWSDDHDGGLEKLTEIIETLLEPDEDSRSNAEEGRRLVKIRDDIALNNCGFRIVNFEYYRDLKTQEEQRAISRETSRKHREKKLAAAQSSDKSVTPGDKAVTPGDKAVTPGDIAVTGGDNTKTIDLDSDLDLDSVVIKKSNWGEPPQGVNPIAWSEWTEYKGGKPAKGTVTKLANKFRQFGDFADQAKAVDHSIASGYKGLWTVEEWGNGHGRKEGGSDRIQRLAEDRVRNILENPKGSSES